MRALLPLKKRTKKTISLSLSPILSPYATLTVFLPYIYIYIYIYIYMYVYIYIGIYIYPSDSSSECVLNVF